MKRSLLLLTALSVSCTKQPAQDETQTASQRTGGPSATSADEAPSTEPAESGDPHLVVFADRTSQAYLLLLPPGEHPAPTREDLQALVKSKLATASEEPELALLLELIATEPTPVAAGPGDGSPRATRDLLGLNIDVLAVGGSKGAVGSAALGDPILTRALTPEQRASLRGRTQALLLRAEYRNQYAVRGLRLLQTLTRIVALERSALVHDPDTGETVGVDTFTKRRLKSSLSNVAEQIAVVPFIDKMNPDGVRLSTRGMRRFGSPDLELDGLPRDPKVLQRATDLLNGLAVLMVQLGEFDSTGYAVELGQVVEVSVDDVARSYADASHVPECAEDCVGEADVHLVERPAEPHDPEDHVVVRVIAPREQSDSVDYDHAKWVTQILSDVFGKG
ncbi:MAG: hypothetical protein KUG77_24100 [Nannocystaceae bacterium]|nr:hypothetical protein [Nannocystaceae bacterium]